MAQSQQASLPERFYLAPTPSVPNNNLPILLYRNVLPKPYNSAKAKEFCEGNGWEMRGEWGAITTHHFHPNTPECYAIVRGSSQLLLGRGQHDKAGGVEVLVRTGDVIVLPPGISHCSVSAEEGYWYIGVYPPTAPKWRNLYCEGEEKMEELRKEIDRVEIPDFDPVFGRNGPLTKIWREAKAVGQNPRANI
ncbi:hypothetical protein K402DRAFT_139814 [Aulographum hederae CBS 113979]|uniref:Cupin type-1 domain-containing protein n=1 Tax=Aulographum hederae CBS 113979 TaxID=1176131 RepID=A0A6G1GUW6_9PEZI|nr:hypothetical protein K402DRAFT_139814 [Aulographum hederae CBS 113979]